MLLRYDPFREIERQIDHLFRDSSPAMPLDASRREEDFVIEFDLPGVKADSIDITVERNVLTVEAERESSRTDGWEPLVSERRHGKFRREVYLGEGLDSDKVTATYRDGVLTLVIPLAESSKPRKVAINQGADEPIEVMATAS